MNLDNVQVTTDCLKRVENFGSTTWMNVCNGTSHVVPWGSMSIFMVVFVLLILVWLGVFMFKNKDY